MAGGSQLGPFPSTPLTHRGIAKPYLVALVGTNRQWPLGTTRSEPRQSHSSPLSESNNFSDAFKVADLRTIEAMSCDRVLKPKSRSST